jgi:L-arabinose isomerase
MDAERLKPKLGLVFFTAKWFEEVLQGSDTNSIKFTDALNTEKNKIKNTLSEDFLILEEPFVSSLQKAREISEDLLAKDIDCLLLCFLVWAEDEYLIPFKDIMLIRPSILWAYTPYIKPPSLSDATTIIINSGIVGSFISFGVLRRMEVKPILVIGSSQEEEPYEKIRKIGKASKLLKDLKTSRLGLLPYRSDLMIVTYVDEFRLYSQIGPVVEYVSVLQLKKAAESIPDSVVKEYVKDIKTRFKIDNRITDKNLYNSACASLGLEKIIFDKNFNGLALNDLNDELHEVMGLRPCLYPERLALSDKVIGMEGDLGCSIAMYMMRELAGKPVMFTEIYNYDRLDNTVVAGHAGPSNYLLAEDYGNITITPDYEYMNSSAEISGAWMEFIGKPGEVTLLNLVCTKNNFRFTILRGQSLGGKLRTEGCPHYYIKIEPVMDRFINAVFDGGISHHWALVNEDIIDELSYLADMLNAEKVVL